MTSRARRDAGFTLIEVLVVIAILAVAAGIVVGRGPDRSPMLDARVAAGQIARGLRVARSEAVRGNRPVAFTLDMDRHGFSVGASAMQALPPGVNLTMVAMAEATPNQALGRIVFAPDGGATGGRIGVAAGGVLFVVSVDWLSGRVTVADDRR